MTIYEFLGIEEFLIKEEIPINLIIENIDNDDLKENANRFFDEISSIYIRASVKRSKNFLQVIEIHLINADHIEEISKLIQMAIKYQILFIFCYEERYLFLYRNYTLSQKTDCVSTRYKSYSTDWIYQEYLEEDYLAYIYTNDINSVIDDDYVERTGISRNEKEHSDYAYFSDILDNVSYLNNAIINSDYVCMRYFLDWVKSHNYKQNISIFEVLNYAKKFNNYVMIGDYMFIEKNSISNAITKLCHYKYPLMINHTGRHPVYYFKNKTKLATYSEADELMNYVLYEKTRYINYDYAYEDEEAMNYVKQFVNLNSYMNFRDEQKINYYFTLLKNAPNLEVLREGEFVGNESIINKIRKEKKKIKDKISATLVSTNTTDKELRDGLLSYCFDEYRNIGKNDFTNTKPMSFSFDGKEYYVRSWSDLYLKVIKLVKKENSTSFRCCINTNITNGQRLDFTDNTIYASTKMIYPKKVFENIWVETNNSSSKIMSKIKALLKICEIEFKRLNICYVRKENIESNYVVFDEQNAYKAVCKIIDESDKNAVLRKLYEKCKMNTITYDTFKKYVRVYITFDQKNSLAKHLNELSLSKKVELAYLPESILKKLVYSDLEKLSTFKVRKLARSLKKDKMNVVNVTNAEEMASGVVENEKKYFVEKAARDVVYSVDKSFIEKKVNSKKQEYRNYQLCCEVAEKELKQSWQNFKRAWKIHGLDKILSYSKFKEYVNIYSVFDRNDSVAKHLKGLALEFKEILLPVADKLKNVSIENFKNEKDVRLFVAGYISEIINDENRVQYEEWSENVDKYEYIIRDAHNKIIQNNIEKDKHLYLSTQIKVGASIRHSLFGIGRITSVGIDYIRVKFKNSEREFKIPDSIENKILNMEV